MVWFIECNDSSQLLRQLDPLRPLNVAYRLYRRNLLIRTEIKLQRSLSLEKAAQPLDLPSLTLHKSET